MTLTGLLPQASLAAWRKTAAKLRDLAALHAWLHHEHACYSVAQQVLCAEIALHVNSQLAPCNSTCVCSTAVCSILKGHMVAAQHITLLEDVHAAVAWLAWQHVAEHDGC